MKKQIRAWLAAPLGIIIVVGAARAQTFEFSFDAKAAGEAVADVIAASPGGSWANPGAEAAVATISLDGHYNHDVVIDRGARDATYSVFLGPVTAGRHRVRIERSPRWSAVRATLQV